MAPRWDIFCAVVDHFGDIGVSWRLARQLAAEHGLAVRLWVDDLAGFRRLCPDLDPQRDAQRLRGVEIRRWRTPLALEPGDVADVVIAAFGCRLPENYLDAMAARAPAPRWINLEYLSAENWVASHHGLPSPHPRRPLTQHFFFPGFTAGSGGLLRERELLPRRDLFQRDGSAQAAFWSAFGAQGAMAADMRISLFGYPQGGAAALMRTLIESGRRIFCAVPESELLREIAPLFGRAGFQPGDNACRAGLTLGVLPFVPQERYDELLWACDLNFVRGEDSFVRAQWAGRPLVWQIYPQRDGAHWAKLEAFLQRYCAPLSAPAAAVVSDLWQAWNRDDGLDEAWRAWLARRAILEAHAVRWADGLAQAGDLAGNLVAFCAAGP